MRMAARLPLQEQIDGIAFGHIVAETFDTPDGKPHMAIHIYDAHGTWCSTAYDEPIPEGYIHGPRRTLKEHLEAPQ
jgi:hypothetical protein